MNAPPLSARELQGRLAAIKAQVSAWLRERRARGNPFGRFSLCKHAYAEDELNAATGGIELWLMLGLPLRAHGRQEAIASLQSYQNPETGLVSDPSWASRQKEPNPQQLTQGDTFFTMTAFYALKALGTHFRYPVKYLMEVSGEELIVSTLPLKGAHRPFAIGDYGALLELNDLLGVATAKAQRKAVSHYLQTSQDPQTGLWPKGEIKAPFTPAINRAFHHTRTTWNAENHPYPLAPKIIDTCLAAADDTSYYSWEHGFSCNDLDLAVMLYSASRWTDHRRGDVAHWAAARLPMILSVQKEDGGFSFYHDRAMLEHAGIKMSPGEAEGDMWGTLMYLGTIKMMVELSYTITAPWKFSRVHQVPGS